MRDQRTLLNLLRGEQNMAALAIEITTALLDSHDKAPLRLRLITSLYNMLPSHTKAQFEVNVDVNNTAMHTC